MFTSAITKSSSNSWFYRFWRLYYASRRRKWFCNNWSGQFDLGDFKLKLWHAEQLLTLDTLKQILFWKMDFKEGFKFIFIENQVYHSSQFYIVLCRPQRGKRGSMGCLQSNSKNFIFFFLLSQQNNVMLPKYCQNFSIDPEDALYRS